MSARTLPQTSSTPGLGYVLLRTAIGVTQLHLVSASLQSLTEGFLCVSVCLTCLANRERKPGPQHNVRASKETHF